MLPQSANLANLRPSDLLLFSEELSNSNMAEAAFGL